MREFWPSMLLTFPVTVYVGAVVLGVVPSSDTTFTGTFVAMLFLAILSTLPSESIHLGATVGLLGLSVSVIAVLYLAPAIGVELLAGSLLALPALLVSYAVRPGPLGWRLVAFGVALTEGLALLATEVALTAAKVVVAGDQFVREFVFLNVTQLRGIEGLLASSGGALPLRDVFDPVFVVLAAIAAAGLLIPALRPQTAWDNPLPTAGDPPAWGEVKAREVDLGGALAAALEERSSPEPASRGLPPGFSPLLCGSVAAVLLVAVAFLSPGLTFPLLVAGIIPALAATLALMRRPIPERH
ncbi:MAG: hypothetical protein L3J97_01675 [Thermoplasmata archaeon]|nr:hypothetical protein [Thermoplasmata archaeon]